MTKKMLPKICIIASLLLTAALAIVLLSSCSGKSAASQTNAQQVDTGKIVSTYYEKNKPAKAGFYSSSWLWYSQVSAQGMSGKIYQPDTCLNSLYATSASSSSATAVGCLLVFLDSSGKPVAYEPRLYSSAGNTADIEIAIERFSKMPGSSSGIRTYVYYLLYADGSTWGDAELGSKASTSQMEELISKGVFYDLGASNVMKVG